MLTLAMVSLPANSPAISSSAGPIILQGPHHSAQKSTSTGPSAFSTSVAKVSSVTGLVFALILTSVYRKGGKQVACQVVGRLGGSSRLPLRLRLGHMRVEQCVRQNGDPRGLGPDQRALHRT